MICPHCGKTIGDGVRFCTSCGKTIPRCPTCGTLLTRRSRFCVKDGTPIPEDILALIPDGGSRTEEKISAVVDEVLSESALPPAESSPKVSLEKLPEPPKPAAPRPDVFAAGPTPAAANRRFCIQCGKPFHSSGQTVCPECAARARFSPPPPPPRKSRAVPILLGVLALLLAAGIGTMGFFVARDGLPAVFQHEEKDDSRAGDTRDDDDEAKPRVKKGAQSDSQEPVDSSAFGPGKTSPEAPDAPSSAVVTPAAPSAPAEPSVPAMLPITEAPEPETPDERVVQFIIYCDSVYFTRRDLEGFTAQMCTYARNGIYARSGRKFQSENLQEYFSQFYWYLPLIEPDDFTESILNDYQIANRDLIVAYEQEQGYR